MNFRATLAERQRKINSLVCVGLDPLVERMPDKFQRGSGALGERVGQWMREIVEQTVDYASMFKPQRAHWESIPGGADELQGVAAYIHGNFPDVPVFLDCKRGDIDRTQRQYREAHFAIDGVDGMNYSGYMGSDTLKQLIDKDHLGRALVGLGRTSNQTAWQVQDRLLADGRKVWEAAVQDILDWSTEFGVLENAGVVMGAAHAGLVDSDVIYNEHLKKARMMVGGKLWFLIPGIGTQGGFIEQTVDAAYDGPGSIAINSSSQIIFADSPGVEARKLRDTINRAL